MGHGFSRVNVLNFPQSTQNLHLTWGLFKTKICLTFARRALLMRSLSLRRAAFLGRLWMSRKRSWDSASNRRLRTEGKEWTTERLVHSLTCVCWEGDLNEWGSLWPVLRVLQGFAPEGAQINSHHLWTVDHLPQRPHEGAVHPHQLLRVYLGAQMRNTQSQVSSSTWSAPT